MSEKSYVNDNNLFIICYGASISPMGIPSAILYIDKSNRVNSFVKILPYIPKGYAQKQTFENEEWLKQKYTQYGKHKYEAQLRRDLYIFNSYCRLGRFKQNNKNLKT